MIFRFSDKLFSLHNIARHLVDVSWPGLAPWFICQGHCRFRNAGELSYFPVSFRFVPYKSLWGGVGLQDLI